MNIWKCIESGANMLFKCLPGNSQILISQYTFASGSGDVSGDVLLQALLVCIQLTNYMHI